MFPAKALGPTVFDFNSLGLESMQHAFVRQKRVCSCLWACPWSRHLFDISMAEIELIIGPNGITDDAEWESMAFGGIHAPIQPISAF